MRSKGNNRTAKEKQWHETVADFAQSTNWMALTYGKANCNYTQFHIDHFLGAQAKRKIKLISEKVGEFAVIACPIELHDSQDKRNIFHREREFNKLIDPPKLVFISMLNSMKLNGYEIPFDDDWVRAITR